MVVRERMRNIGRLLRVSSVHSVQIPQNQRRYVILDTQLEFRNIIECEKHTEAESEIEKSTYMNHNNTSTFAYHF